MFFDPFEVTTPHVIYALLGAFAVLFGMFSLFLRERLYIGEAIWAFIFGIIIGPFGANIFNPRSWGNSTNPNEPINEITIEYTRVVLAVGVFAIGVELPKAYMVKHWRSLFFLLVPVMTWGWFVCAGLIYAFIPGINFLSSLAISACLTPTDPILASAVVGGKWADKHVPAHLRHLLAAESGCNDGAAFPFLFFALYLMTDLPDLGKAMRDWFVILWLYQIVLGVLIGALIGFSFRHLMKFCQRRDLIDRHSYVAQYLSLAILTIGITTLLGSDDLLAAFACGAAFAWDGFFNKQTEESVFSSVIDVLFNVAAFIYVGAWMPFNRFHINVEGLGGIGMGVEVWRLIVLAILVLLLRRLPIMMGLYRWIPDVKTWREAVFSGHFGPMGIGAIFLSTYAAEFLHQHPSTGGSDYQLHQNEMVLDLIQPVVAFMVLCSITIHGLSIPGFSLGRRVHSVSRTWSRRDTTGSGRAGAPDWTNHARLVTRGDDIVINRDLEKGEGGKRGGVPLERTMTMISMRTLNNSNSDGQKDDKDGLTSDVVTEEVNFHVDTTPVSFAPTTTTTTPIIQRPDQELRTQGTQDDQEYDCRNQYPPDGEHHQTTEWTEGDQRVVERRSGRSGDDVEVIVIDNAPHHRKPNVTSWTGQKIHELERGAEDLGCSMRDGVRRTVHLGRRHGDAAAGTCTAVSGTGGEDIEMENRKRRRRPTTADTLVADEDTDGPWMSDGSQYSQQDEDAEVGVAVSGPEEISGVSGPGIAISGDTIAAAPVTREIHARQQRPTSERRTRRRRSSSLTRTTPPTSYLDQAPLGGMRPSRRSTGGQDSVNLNLDTDYDAYDDYDAEAANAVMNVDDEIVEVPRGREVSMSRSSMTLNPQLGIGMGRNSVASSILPPIFPPPSIPLSYSPNSPLPSAPPPVTRSRPRTAPTSSTPASVAISRPGTGDSTNSIRHHRLDSIRANNSTNPHHGHGHGHGHGHRTPTRDSSPSRSVRFVDYVDGEGGYVGYSGSAGAAVPPPPMPAMPRSSSFYRDGRDGVVRTLVDSPVDEEGISSSKTSRPPTR